MADALCFYSRSGLEMSGRLFGGEWNDGYFEQVIIRQPSQGFHQRVAQGCARALFVASLHD